MLETINLLEFWVLYEKFTECTVLTFNFWEWEYPSFRIYSGFGDKHSTDIYLFDQSFWSYIGDYNAICKCIFTGIVMFNFNKLKLSSLLIIQDKNVAIYYLFLVSAICTYHYKKDTSF
jgi:hypothetical protein